MGSLSERLPAACCRIQTTRTAAHFGANFDVLNAVCAQGGTARNWTAFGSSKCPTSYLSRFYFGQLFRSGHCEAIASLRDSRAKQQRTMKPAGEISSANAGVSTDGLR